MPDNGALGEQKLADVVGFAQGADQMLGAGVVPEPNADLRVGEGMGCSGIHEGAVSSPHCAEGF